MNIIVIGEVWKSKDNNLFCFPRIDEINIRGTFSSLEIWENQKGWQRVDGVIWRIWHQQDCTSERSLLEIIERSGVPCVNPAKSVLLNNSRLSNLTLLERAGFPINISECRFGLYSKLQIDQIDTPIVLKVGNFHSGFGKALARSKEQLTDLIDLAIVSNEFITVEPYINYKRDIRCLVMGDKVRAVEKKSMGWKANVDPYRIDEVPVPEDLHQQSIEIARLLECDVLGVDWVEEENGEWKLLEVNLSPDLSLTPEKGKRNQKENQNLILEMLRKRMVGA